MRKAPKRTVHGVLFMPVRRKSARRVASTKGQRENPRKGSLSRSKTKSGNPGYAGYEYQVQVTAWVALYLMVAKEACDQILIEPKSEEDIEAAVHDPEVASLGVAPADLNLLVQVKTRSSAPWSVAEFGDVLRTETSCVSGAQGRQRPLDMLLADPRRRYVFITNESLSASLRSFEGQHILDFSDQAQLPASVRKGMSPAQLAQLEKRIAICSGLSVELLDSRIKRLLSVHCHVPEGEQSACIKELSHEVRRRMMGGEAGLWTREALTKVCAQHGGSVLSTRTMDHYIQPRSYDRIRQILTQRHAVIISGPSGTGKTLTADIVELAFRKLDPPFAVVGGELGPTHVRSQFARSEPLLFHLRDPWGSNRISEEAERWSTELPKLLSQAAPNRKFLITSRSDVMSSAGYDLLKKLDAYIVPIEIEDYGPTRLAQIYDGISSDLTGAAANLARKHRRAALNNLGRPFEIDRFLVAVSEQDPIAPEEVGKLIKRSQIDAISSVVADQVLGSGSNGIAAAAVIWALLNAREAITTESLIRVARKLRDSQPTTSADIDGMVNFLTAGRNLRRHGAELSFYHPRVEDGLRIAIVRKRIDTEPILSRLVDVLTSLDDQAGDWGVETVLGILRAVNNAENMELSFSEDTHARLDVFLIQSFLKASKVSDSVRSIEDLGRFGSDTYSPSQLARILLPPGRDPNSDTDFFGDYWRPPHLSEETARKLREDPLTTPLLQHFVADVLPFTRVRYSQSLVPLINTLSNELTQAYLDAIDTIAHPGGPNENMEAIIEGASSGDAPDYDWLIERFAKAEAEADEWFEGFSEKYRQAEEHEIDAAYADRIFDEPQEQFYNSQQGLEKVAVARYRREGIEWLRSHPRRSLLVRPLASAIKNDKGSCSIETLRTLIDCGRIIGGRDVWDAVRNHWDEALLPILSSELARTGIEGEGLRQSLLETLYACVDTASALLANIASNTSSARRIELLVDLMSTSFDTYPRKEKDAVAVRRARANELLSTFASPEADLGAALVSALSGATIPTAANKLTAPAKDLLRHLLPAAPISSAPYLTVLAAASGLDAGAAIDRLLAHGDANAGQNAVVAIGLEPDPTSSSKLYSALAHARYKVRRDALDQLVTRVSEKERIVLLPMAKDASADIRLAWAERMEKHQWPEAIPSLVNLLSDDRSFNSDYGVTDGPVWAVFRVARAAAVALGAYETLPTTALDALLNAATAENADPFVPCAVISALATKDDPRIEAALVEGLRSTGLPDSVEHRPLAQAAAWAVFDRTMAHKLATYGPGIEEAAFDPNPAIAAPLLMALALSDSARRQSLIRKLREENLTSRVELVEAAAAILGGSPSPGGNGPSAALAQMIAKGSVSSESSAEELKRWSLSLDPKRDVEVYTAWLAEKACNLPVQKTLENPRAFDLPKRLGLLTMRSLTPAREVGDRSPDDGSSRR